MSGIPGGTEPAGAEYFREVEAEFIRLRGTPFLLSPMDYAAVRRWQDLGVPVSDVLDGIRFAFARRAERGSVGRVNSLRYCEGAILEAWERNAALRVGRTGTPRPPSAETAEEALQRLDGELRDLSVRHSGIAADAERARKSLIRLQAAGATPEKIDEGLARVEKRLLKASGAALSEAEGARLDGEIDSLLARAGGERMSAAAAERTREVLRRQWLRERWEIPRLTLLGR